MKKPRHPERRDDPHQVRFNFLPGIQAKFRDDAASCSKKTGLPRPRKLRLATTAIFHATQTSQITAHAISVLTRSD